MPTPAPAKQVLKMGRLRNRGATLACRLALLLTFLCLTGEAGAQTAPAAAPQGFVAPPRSIADITAVLDSDKPDPARLARYVALADAQPPTGGSPSRLARFYLDRSAAAGEIGRVQQVIKAESVYDYFVESSTSFTVTGSTPYT